MTKVSQIKSKKRVRDFGEVYTPSHIVKDMCDLAPIISDIHTTVLEPSFGNGNFLVEIYERKLKNCKTGDDILDVVKSVYGIELLEDNVKEAKGRLWQLIKDTGIKLSDSNARQIIIAMNLNLQQGDTLTQIKRNGKKIQFIDWRIK